MPRRTWTDDQLRNVIAACTTWVGVLRALRLSPKGRNHYSVTVRARQLGVDTSHFRVNARRVCDDELRAVIAHAQSFESLANLLGLEQDRDERERLRHRVRALGLDTSHFVRGQASPTRTKRRSWSDEDLRAAVASAYSFAGALRQLGLVAAGGNYESVQRRIKELSLDTTHFTGQGWNVGLKYQPAPARPLSELLVVGRWTSSHHLKTRLFREGLKEPRCELCGWCERAPDGRTPVELDHINGDRFDNRLENLRILCPNCHSLQSTHRGLNKKTMRLKR